MLRQRNTLLAMALVTSPLFSSCGEMLAFKEGTKKTENVKKDEEGEFQLGKADPLEFYSFKQTGLKYADDVSRSEAWIYLVAGSINGANFGQEVIDQKKMWMQRGVSAEEIACYFVIPDKENFDGDKAQYKSLAKDLQSCEMASMKAIAIDLRASADAGHDNLYIYVSSHGSPSMSYYADAQEPGDEKDKFEYLVKNFPILDEYAVSLDATTNQSANLGIKLNALQEGADADELFLTPRTLADAISSFGDGVQKTVVLQGCYSGGFIDEYSLANVANMEILTAARNDRPSFGCGLDDKTTYFGGAVHAALANETTAAPDAINWKKIYDKVDEIILELETQEDFTPSEPQYFSNK